ncbi:type VI secretion system baseplate subunit TssE [Paralcaligenes sp. KSB-10]|jgi:type VI secretion system protein|uniref:type VI secretion system baseplate subunit TssE n=1 Tax=Paralcaligenes sp. KSB-10 TaxID=2901142 RepID=UPI001E2A1258|nr:type VI secretion system baseplate subunit TssE [Paralcaligenes sp. KSB-10]UHL65671.1 type VI secretion system baseplate subunit TssE [Paralcaligenes sp. KSB-10]
MQEQRLLERIASFNAGGGRSHMTRAEILVDSILSHLRRILNTRQGSVPIDPEFGVPDFTNLAGSFSVGTTSQISDDMTRMIERYEPRLKKPLIEFIEIQDSVLTLAFSITGLIEVDNLDIPIRLSTQVLPNGKVSLRKS